MESPQKAARKRQFATGLGFAAIFLWSTSIAFNRSLSEQLGPVTAGASVYGVSGVLALISLARNNARQRQAHQFSRVYLVVCGLLFLSYTLAFVPAIGLAHNRQQALEIGLLNYLWPPFTVILTVLLLGKQARLMLVPATILALAGIFLVLTQEDHVSWQSLAGNLAANPPAYTLGFAAAVSWAVYSVLTRKWADRLSPAAVLFFMPAVAIMFLLICPFVDEPRAWNMRSVVETALFGLITFLSYGFWNTAMRAGNVVVVVAASYLTPIFSAVVTCLYLAVAPQPQFWVGCAILLAGSLLSWNSISDRGAPGKPENRRLKSPLRT